MRFTQVYTQRSVVDHSCALVFKAATEQCQIKKWTFLNLELQGIFHNPRRTFILFIQNHKCQSNVGENYKNQQFFVHLMCQILCQPILYIYKKNIM